MPMPGHLHEFFAFRPLLSAAVDVLDFFNYNTAAVLGILAHVADLER
jgi:hypothetical protein